MRGEDAIGVARRDRVELGRPAEQLLWKRRDIRFLRRPAVRGRPVAAQDDADELAHAKGLFLLPMLFRGVDNDVGSLHHLPRLAERGSVTQTRRCQAKKEGRWHTPEVQRCT